MMEHYQHKNKCLACGLHFVVCSWNEAWPQGIAKAVYCPECGGANTSICLAVHKVAEPIFRVVPGHATAPGELRRCHVCDAAYDVDKLCDCEVEERMIQND